MSSLGDWLRSFTLQSCSANIASACMHAINFVYNKNLSKPIERTRTLRTSIAAHANALSITTHATVALAAVVVIALRVRT